MTFQNILQPCYLCLDKINSHGGIRWKNIKWKNRRAPPQEAYNPTAVENLANVLTHGIWVVPSISATLELLDRAQNEDQRVSAMVYGASLVLSFCVSTFFHLTSFCRKNGRLKMVLHQCDRASIYAFIAGSYFPWLTLEKTPYEKCMSFTKWTNFFLALLGIVYQKKFHERHKNIETALYIVVGCGPALFLSTQHTFPGEAELALGGALYLMGVVFFKCDGIIPCAHAIWHVFTVLGATVHYNAVLRHLYPKEIN